MKHPKRKVRRLQDRIWDLKASRTEFLQIISDTRRALDQLDGGYPERNAWTPAHRILVYRKEQELQLKANELGAAVSFVCASGTRVRFDETQSAPDAAAAFHTHRVEPNDGITP